MQGIRGKAKPDFFCIRIDFKYRFRDNRTEFKAVYFPDYFKYSTWRDNVKTIRAKKLFLLLGIWETAIFSGWRHNLCLLLRAKT
jgi:hypothetical protein